MNTYEAYLKHEAGNIITVEECMEIYSKMVESISSCKVEDKMDFWNEFIKYSGEYAYIRNKWETMSREEKMHDDDSRTVAHNSVIRSIDKIARLVEGDGGDASWRSQLGDKNEKRKRIGDFACFVSYITGISNR